MSDPTVPMSDPTVPMSGPRVPMRTCAACRQPAPRAELARFVAVDGVLAADPMRIRPGRGVHLHPTAACRDRARRRGLLARALRVPAELDLSVLDRWEPGESA